MLKVPLNTNKPTNLVFKVTCCDFVQTIEDAVDYRLRILSDLTVECNELDKADADRIWQAIAELKVRLMELRMRLADDAQSLRQQKARTRKQKDDSQQSSSDVQKWFEDTRKMTVEQADVSTDASQDNEVCCRSVS